MQDFNWTKPITMKIKKPIVTKEVDLEVPDDQTAFFHG
jgi:hypothetical protein